jgi:hypothetical protein
VKVSWETVIENVDDDDDEGRRNSVNETTQCLLQSEI